MKQLDTWKRKWWLCHLIAGCYLRELPYTHNHTEEGESRGNVTVVTVTEFYDDRALAQSRNFHRGVPVSIPGQTMWDRRWHHWKYFGFTLSVSFYQCHLLYYLSPMLCNLRNMAASLNNAPLKSAIS